LDITVHDGDAWLTHTLLQDLAGGWRDNIVETRRSNRSKGEQSAVMRLPYMAWRNTAASK
jgi:hypothetical protein